jgi:hypothetical protein
LVRWLNWIYPLANILSWIPATAFKPKGSLFANLDQKSPSPPFWERAASFKDDAGHALPNTNNFSFSHRASDYYGYKIGQLIPDFIKKNGGEGDFWSRFANKQVHDQHHL